MQGIVILERHGEYHNRQKSKRLHTALCAFEVIDGREALATHFESAAIVTPESWGSLQLNVNGRVVCESGAEKLTERIAATGQFSTA